MSGWIEGHWYIGEIPGLMKDPNEVCLMITQNPEKLADDGRIDGDSRLPVVIGFAKEWVEEWKRDGLGETRVLLDV